MLSPLTHRKGTRVENIKLTANDMYCIVCMYVSPWIDLKFRLQHSFHIRILRLVYCFRLSYFPLLSGSCMVSFHEFVS